MAWQAARRLSMPQALRAVPSVAKAWSQRSRFFACSQILRFQSEVDSPPPHVQDRLFRYRTVDKAKGKARKDSALALRKLRPVADLTEEQRAIINSIRQCTQELDWQGALAIYRQFPPDAGKDWIPCFRAVLNCLCKSLRYEESKTVFESLPSRDVVSYNSMLGLLARLRLHDEAQALLQRMDHEGIARTGVTQCQVITGFAEAHRWAEAVELLQQLKSDVPLHETVNWEVAYLVSMTACARAHQHDKARALLEELRATHEGSVKNTHYNALLISCGSDGDAADRVLQELKAAGLTPRAEDWRAYLWSHRDSKEQQQRYQQMRQELPSAPLEETWGVLLRTAAANDDAEAAEWVIQEMSNHGCEIDSERAESVPPLRRAIAIYRKWRRRQMFMDEPASRNEEGMAASSLPDGWQSTVDPTSGMAASSLPDGWQSTVDPTSGRPYYWHVDNPAGTTTWDLPKI